MKQRRTLVVVGLCLLIGLGLIWVKSEWSGNSHMSVKHRLDMATDDVSQAISERWDDFWFFMRTKLARPVAVPKPAGYVYNGPADDLKGTQLAFTPQAQLAEGKNLVWCSSFELAWQQAQSHLTTGTLSIPSLPELTRQLNATPPAKASLPENWYYLGFGELPNQKLLPKLTKELQAKFPDASAPRLPEYDPTLQGFLSLAYLRGGAVFNPAFKEEPRELVFPGVDGKPVQVSCFGIDDLTALAKAEVREHVRILYTNADDVLGNPGLDLEMVLDLAADNPTIQVILARVPSKATLEATWQASERLATEWSTKHQTNKAYWGFKQTDTLTVPVIAFQLDKLWLLKVDTPGKPEWEVNPYYLYQQVGFSLTASGALVESTGGAYPGCAPRHFTFDRPFLIALKLRKAEEPFFLMWVANAELMRKR